MVQLDPVATIDLTEFQTRKLEITKELMAAASDIGFFRVKGALWGATHRPLWGTTAQLVLLHRCEIRIFTNPAAAG